MSKISFVDAKKTPTNLPGNSLLSMLSKKQSPDGTSSKLQHKRVSTNSISSKDMSKAKEIYKPLPESPRFSPKRKIETAASVKKPPTKAE